MPIETEFEHACCPVVVFAFQAAPTTEFVQVFGPSAIALRVRSLEGLLSIAEDVPNGIFLVRAEGFEGPHDLHRWRSAHPVDWTTILLLARNTASIRATLSWLTHWPLPVLLDRPASGLIAADERVHAKCWAAARESCRMIRYLASELMSANPIVAASLIAVYGSPHAPDSLKQLAADCRMSDRHVRRLMTSLGLPSSYLYFSASRVLRAYEDVVRGELALAEIARQHEFGTARTLRSEWLDVTGAPLQSARGVPLTDGLVASIAERMVERMA